MISTRISSASAGFLVVVGIALLFASDVILPRVIPAFPAGAAWLGQLLGAAWLAMAAFNWVSRSALLGGIYGRPVMLTNAVLYFISATVLFKGNMRSDAPAAFWIAAVPIVLFAGIYGWLLLRGPIQSDFEIQQKS